MFKVKGQKNFIFQGFLIVFKVLRNFFALKCSLKLFIWMRTVNTRRLIPHLYTSSVTCDVTYGKNDILRYFAYSLSRRCWVWGPYEPKIHPRTAKLNWFSVTVFLTSAISRILRIHEMKKLLDLVQFENLFFSNSLNFFPWTKKCMTYEKTAPTILTFWWKLHQKRSCPSKLIAKKLIVSGSCQWEGEWLKNALNPLR